MGWRGCGRPHVRPPWAPGPTPSPPPPAPALAPAPGPVPTRPAIATSLQIFKVTQYNVACCYASINQVAPGLEALDAALAAGFDDYKKVRSDPNLAGLRADKAGFDAVIDKYDEPIINQAAVNALKSLFSFGRGAGDE